MVLDLNGWIDGITASGVVIFGIVMGFFFYYESRKRNAKLLTFLGLANLFAGLMFLGVFLDFLFVLTINENIVNNGIVALLSYIWFAPVIISAMYIGVELIAPKIKKPTLIIILIISVVFEIVIFIDPINSFNFIPAIPDSPGINLIDYNVNLLTLAGMLMGGLLLLVIIFLGLGFLYKAIQSSGEIRKKFFLLSAGSICFCIFGLLEGLSVPGILVIFVRLGYVTSFILMYFGL
ncbi:MAG: hypothetical protein ACW96X_01560 [Promethearchaeota archaeon]|jgi:hypothetical protein